jgi:hypothetical protein
MKTIVSHPQISTYFNDSTQLKTHGIKNEKALTTSMIISKTSMYN